MKLKNIYVCFLFPIIINLLNAETYKWNIVHKLNWSTTFTGISNADALNIMASADFGGFPPHRIITKSTDGGLSWNTVYQDSVMWFSYSQNISYPTKNFCIVTCDSNYFLKTTDGGKHWINNKIDIPYTLNGLVHISLYDSLYGIMGSYLDIIYSNDGFKTYKLIDLPRILLIHSIYIVSPTKIYLFATNPNSFLQYDILTDTWFEYSFPIYDPVYTIPNFIYFSDSLNGFVAGYRRTGIGDTGYDMIHKTTNGGKTWIEVLNALNDPPFGLTQVDFCDKENGIAVGQFGKIYWTHDSGNTWFQDYQQAFVDSQPSVMHVSILNKNTSLIADFIGTIWRSSLVSDIPEKNNIEVPIYPNPAESYIYINLPPEFLTEKIKIYSVEGILVYQTSDIFKMSDVSAKIDVSRFAAGVYYVKVRDRVCRFIKM